MKIKGFFTNKYFIGIIILLLVFFTDIIFHKGMTRVLIPNSFTEQRSAKDYHHCNTILINKEKRWLKAINTISLIQSIPKNTNGIEIDVYYDPKINSFYVYHDSINVSQTTIHQILNVYKERQMNASIWFDFKNLTEQNQEAALKTFLQIRSEFDLQNKMIIESSRIDLLKSFCDNEFFTSYYTPFFNPYQMTEQQLIEMVDSISTNLKNYPVNALSGYYFQYPFLKKYFPNYPILTWAEENNFSLISQIFNRTLMKEDHLFIVLYNRN